MLSDKIKKLLNEYHIIDADDKRFLRDLLVHAHDIDYWDYAEHQIDFWYEYNNDDVNKNPSYASEIMGYIEADVDDNRKEGSSKALGYAYNQMRLYERLQKEGYG